MRNAIAAKAAALLCSGMCAAFAIAVPSADAEVRSSMQMRPYHVRGATASALVSYMRSSPFEGSRGAAVANIRPNYALSVKPRMSGAVCRASVSLSIRFTLTLPKAASGGMSPATRSAWNGFVGFAKRHEDTHRRIYMDCGHAFVAKAERLTASSCGALEASIRRMLENDKVACERKQVAFDRADYKRIFGLSLFNMAKQGEGRKPTRLSSASGASR